MRHKHAGTAPSPACAAVSLQSAAKSSGRNPDNDTCWILLPAHNAVVPNSHAVAGAAAGLLSAAVGFGNGGTQPCPHTAPQSGLSCDLLYTGNLVSRQTEHCF